MADFKEAKEVFGTMLRWTQEPKNAEQAEKTVYMGDSIQGFYVNKREGVGANASNVYEIKLPDGQLVSIWGSSLLDGKFNEIPMGCEVRVEYLGIAQPKTSGGRAYANFRVLFDASSRAPMNEVGHPADPRPAANAEVEASAAAAMGPVATAPAPMAPAAPQPAYQAPAPQPAQAPAAPAPASDQGY